MSTGARRLVVADIAKDVKLRLGAPVTEIGNPCALQVDSPPSASHITRIATVRISADRVVDIADQVQWGTESTDPHNGGFSVPESEEHVALVDLLESAHARPSKPIPSLNKSSSSVSHGNEKCCHIPGRSINLRSRFDAGLLGRVSNLGGSTWHAANSFQLWS